MHHSNLTIWNSMNSKPHNNSYSVFLDPTMIGLQMLGRISHTIYFIVSACCLGPEASFQIDHLKLKTFKASQQFVPCIFGVPTMIGLKMVGRMSLIIYFIVSACCLVPEASFQLDHLKLNAFKASRQFIPCTFGSHHDRVKNGRPDESYHQFIVSACCLGAWLVFCL